MLDIYHPRKFRFPDWTGVGHLREDHRPSIPISTTWHAYSISTRSDIPGSRGCCTHLESGAAPLCDRFGLKLILINEKLDGVHFAHNPAISASTIGLQLAR
ncbi:MAG: hypothetical protein WKF37_19155 [Bryobacteraceae bacterium]